MYTFQIRLSPKPGTQTGNLTTEVRASSESEARRIAESMLPRHRLEAVRRVER
jgi:hypothetical protein